ncbi:MAG: hypothetical protein Q4G50_10570 [Corynebacterium sp.]|uniref:hypothetical protein n=1 Tax=Corynebacterium sp. TaxID=1720 RepID=UPI0026DF2425|nr:hypothetical protein [Corynebacterium sp.]MDO5670438.1 hypothetical protein [Corynebacterium sp.]
MEYNFGNFRAMVLEVMDGLFVREGRAMVWSYEANGVRHEFRIAKESARKCLNI